ncbi:protein tilB homolog [Argonauta hians]
MLDYLNLALNNIERIENLEGCESLRKLDLTVNFIGEITSISCLRHLVFFNELYLMGNPCADYEGYRDYVIVKLPHLKNLDGRNIEKSERILAIQNFKATEEKILLQQEKYLAKRKAEKEAAMSKPAMNTTTSPEQNGEAGEGDDATSNSVCCSSEEPAPADKNGGKTEEELEKDFWNEKVPFTPESRVQVHEHMKKVREKENVLFEEKTEEKPRRLFYDNGKPYNVNEPKIDFTLNDEFRDNMYILDVACYKHLDTDLIDVDVQPRYVRVTIKGKIFQLCLNDEVLPDASTAKRSQVTGHLLITMPKMKPIIEWPTKRQEPKRQQKKPLEEKNYNSGRTKTERLEVGENLKNSSDNKVDYCNIVDNNNIKNKAAQSGGDGVKSYKWSVPPCEEPQNSEDFVDDPDVPALI